MKVKKIITGTTAVLMLGSAFAGYGVTAGAAEPTEKNIPVEAYASIGGWQSSNSSSSDWGKNLTPNDGTVHLGGTESGVTEKYIQQGNAAKCDSKVSFIKFDLEGNEDADEYVLKLAYSRAAYDDRSGNYRLGYAIAEMDTTVDSGATSFIKSNGETASTWEKSTSYSYNWSNRPTVGDILIQDQVFENGDSPTLDITDLLKDQTGEITIAVFCEPESETGAEYYYTPSITAVYNDGGSVSDEYTVFWGDQGYADLDAALAAVNGKTYTAKTITIGSDQYIRGNNYYSGKNGETIITSDDSAKRTVILSPSANNADTFSWDYETFKNVKLTQDKNNANSIHNVFAWEESYRNNKATFIESEIYGITTTDCISVFGTNNLSNTSVTNNSVNATLFANRCDSTIDNSTITNNNTNTMGAVQVTSGSTTTIKNSTIKDNNTNGHGDVQLDSGSKVILSGNTEIGLLNNLGGSITLASDFNGSATIRVSGVSEGTVIATVEDGAVTSGITVEGLSDEYELKNENGSLKVVKKAVSGVEYIGDVEKVIDDTTEADKNAVGFVGEAKVTGTAQVGFRVTAENSSGEPVVKDWTYDTVISSEDGATNIVFGLLITDLSDVGLSRDNVTATYLQ